MGLDRRFMTAAVIGGAVTAVLSALPVVNAANCCCCLWMWIGGALAAYMARPSDRKMTNSDGAFAGLMAGVAAAVFSLVIGAVLSAVGYSGAEQAIEALESFRRQMPAGAFEQARRFTIAMTGPLGLLVSFAVDLVLDSVFCTLGGLVASMLLSRSRRTPVQPAD